MRKQSLYTVVGSGILSFAVFLLTSCTSKNEHGYSTTAPSGSRSDLQTFESGHRGEHIVGHNPGTCDLCDLYYQAQSFVVRIRTPEGQGAGIVVGEKGEILTNAHVVGECKHVTIELFSGEVCDADVIRIEPSEDLALLKCDKTDVEWQPIRLEHSDMPRVGTEVYVIGHPIGFGWTVSRGIVSSIRKPGEIALFAMIQTDAAISPGNSGGPCLERFHVNCSVVSIEVGAARLGVCHVIE